MTKEQMIRLIGCNMREVESKVFALVTEQPGPDFLLDSRLSEIEEAVELLKKRTREYVVTLRAANALKALAKETKDERTTERNIRAKAWLEKSGWSSNALVERNLSNEAEQAFGRGDDPVAWGWSLKDRLDLP